MVRDAPECRVLIWFVKGLGARWVKFVVNRVTLLNACFDLNLIKNSGDNQGFRLSYSVFRQL